jgi:gliding motility-associated-like protein
MIAVIKRCLLIGLFGLVLCPEGHATHIVGGEMNYTCLGNDQYEITLTIFRDCFNGNPNAWFDDPASIGVFNTNNLLIQEILIPLMGNDTLVPVLSGECLVVPPNVCVHTTTYSTIVELPPIPGGYQLAYQRCCRNETIFNIIDPLDTGATYGVTISEQALDECNSNPKFQEWPPIYICVNEPIVFDQSAIDQDGDSIVYRLCTPLQGADPDFPMPQPPLNPPYQPINWVSPPYGVDNMLNGSPGGVPLEIDSETGLLTGLPNTIGQFVVGICVEEYRDGALISTTRRDFQYNVGLCGEANAAFVAPEFQCGSLSVAFDNESEGTTNFQWFFNDPGNPGAMSTATNPVFTFSDTGTYTVMLIAAPGEVCEDTSYQEVTLLPNSLEPAFDIELGPCSDTIIVSGIDMSTDEISEIEEWVWTLQPGGLTSNLENPDFVLTESGQYTLTLEVFAENGCSEQLTQQFEIGLIDEELVGDTVATCEGDAIPLNPVFNPEYTYNWAPSADIADLQDPNPEVSPLSTTSYTVTVTSENSDCEAVLSVTVFVPEPVLAEAPPDTTICTQTILLEGQTNTGEQFYWADDANFTNIIGQEQDYLANPQGAATYYLLTIDAFGCRATDSVTVTGNAVDIITSSQQAICPGSFGAVAIVNLDTIDELEVSWSPAEIIVAGANNPTAFVQLDVPGTYELYVEATNQFGCTALDSSSITLIDTSDQVSFLAEVQCGGYTAVFSSESVNAPFYNWFFGDPGNPDAVAFGPEVSYTYPGPGTYEVIVALSSFISCPDTLFTTITIEEPLIDIDFDWEIIGCSDSVVIQFTDQSANGQSEFIAWQWTFSNDSSSTSQNPVLVIDEDQVLTAQLRVLSSDGCVDSVQQSIPVTIPVLNIPDSLLVCPGDSAYLNPFADPYYQYSWSPASFFADPNAANPAVLLDSSQLFTVLASNADSSCMLERTVLASVAPAFDFSIPTDTVLCEEELLLFVDTEEQLDVSWLQIQGSDTTALGNAPELIVQADGNTSFIARLSDEFGCVEERQFEVFKAPILVFLSSSSSICEQDTSMLELVNIGGNPLSYSWQPQAAIISGENTAMPVVSPDEDQEYTVVVTNELGCSQSLSTIVEVNTEIPPLFITATPDTLFEPGSVQLEATIDADYSYLWSPGQGLSNIIISNPVARVDSTITYELTVTDENGCSNTAEITLRVFTECISPYIYVPNAFSPNGDLLNDGLFVRGNSIDELHFVIYNRWGEKVFETRDQSIPWDGTYKGKPLSPDVYAYYLEVRCFNGETYFEKGNISLIR